VITNKLSSNNDKNEIKETESEIFASSGKIFKIINQNILISLTKSYIQISVFHFLLSHFTGAIIAPSPSFTINLLILMPVDDKLLSTFFKGADKSQDAGTSKTDFGCSQVIIVRN
jgi:hypothetical protein